MKLVHKDFKFVFEFKENTRNLLIIEQPSIFLKVIKDFLAEPSEEEVDFVLSENEVPVKIKDHLLCIINPLAISLNERRLLSKLSDILKKEILSSDLLIENNHVVSVIENYALQIIQSTDWELTYSDKIDVPSLLKFIGIQFYEKQETLVEKIMNYMKAAYELLDIKCFVFVHLLSYLTDYEIVKLYEYIEYQKVHMLLLESRQPENMERFSDVVIVDKDACEIVLDMG